MAPLVRFITLGEIAHPGCSAGARVVPAGTTLSGNLDNKFHRCYRDHNRDPNCTRI